MLNIMANQKTHGLYALTMEDGLLLVIRHDFMGMGKVEMLRDGMTLRGAIHFMEEWSQAAN